MTRTDSPKISIVVLSWNTKDLLRSCLMSLGKMTGVESQETIVVDNASADSSAEMVQQEFPDVRLIRNDQNLGYAAGNNVGIAASAGEYVFLLNSDTEVEADAVSRLVSFLEEHRDYGAVGAQLMNTDGTVQRACMRFPSLSVAVGFDTFFGKHFPFKAVIDRYFMSDFDHMESCDVDQPPAAALMLPRRVLDQVGLLDEDLFLFFNDVDLCRRLARSGFKIRFLAEARVAHHGGASTRLYGEFALEWHRNRARYYLRWHGRTGFFIARCMTAWRGLEEWWNTTRKMTDRNERAESKRQIMRVVREVFVDPGRGDPRVAGNGQKMSVSPIE